MPSAACILTNSYPIRAFIHMHTRQNERKFEPLLALIGHYLCSQWKRVILQSNGLVDQYYWVRISAMPWMPRSFVHTVGHFLVNFDVYIQWSMFGMCAIHLRLYNTWCPSSSSYTAHIYILKRMKPPNFTHIGILLQWRFYYGAHLDLRRI